MFHETDVRDAQKLREILAAEDQAPLYIWLVRLQSQPQFGIRVRTLKPTPSVPLISWKPSVCLRQRRS